MYSMSVHVIKCTLPGILLMIQQFVITHTIHIPALLDSWFTNTHFVNFFLIQCPHMSVMDFVVSLLFVAEV
jgi:hypothetical protein